MTIKVLAFDEMQIFDRKSINIDPKAMAVMLVAFANVDGEQLPLVFQIKPEGLKWRIIMCEGGIEALWDDLISYYINRKQEVGRMKKIFLSVLLCTILFSLVGCEEQNETVETEAQVIADVFTDGDMETINKTILGTNEIEIDDGLSDIWREDAQSQDGVLAYVFDLIIVKVKKTTDSTIEYKIEAPDMSKVFMDIDTNATNMAQDELLQYIKNYAQSAETKQTTVSLEYILVDDKPIVNYQDEEFINAVTGGLLDAYKTLYLEMLEEYTEGVD